MLIKAFLLKAKDSIGKPNWALANEVVIICPGFPIPCAFADGDKSKNRNKTARNVKTDFIFFFLKTYPNNIIIY